MVDGNLDDSVSRAFDERRNETVKFTIEMNVFENLSTISLEGGAEILQIDAGRLRHQPVGDS